MNAPNLDTFLKTKFTEQIVKCYVNLKLLTEADLQVRTWFYLRRFLKRSGAQDEGFRILNKPYFKVPETYPDCVIFKGDKPWGMVELKKRRNLDAKIWISERSKLLEAQALLHLERCYLIWAARYGTSASVCESDTSTGGIFVGVPIILEERIRRSRLERLEPIFQKWSKFETK